LDDEALVKPARKIWSIGIVVVMVSAWLAISNHCALGTAVIGPETKSSPDECPFHSKPAPPAKQKQTSDSPCCKILRAVVSVPAKAFARTNTGLVDIHSAFRQFVVLAPPKISSDSPTLDTGPPGAYSFAELILQRSILAHAPPISA
jgi:hypothetical protein